MNIKFYLSQNDFAELLKTDNFSFLKAVLRDKNLLGQALAKNLSLDPTEKADEYLLNRVKAIRTVLEGEFPEI